MDNQQLEKTAGRKILNVVGIVLCIILIPFLIINITIIARSFLYPDKVPSFMNFKPFIVLSDSMLPAIKSGDLVLVRQVNTSELAKGDIIAYKEGDSVITHRIVRIDEVTGGMQYITKGDSNNAEDTTPVTADMVEGTYLLHIHNLGNVALFMQEPLGIMLFIALPLILFILYDILRRRLADSSKRKRPKELEKELEKMQKVLSSLESMESFVKQTETETPQFLNIKK